MTTMRRGLARVRTRQTRKSRAIIRSGATEAEMRRMADMRKRGTRAVVETGPARTRTIRGKTIRVATPASTGARTRTSRSNRLVPSGDVEREARVLRRGRESLRGREKGRPTPGADRKTTLE